MIIFTHKVRMNLEDGWGRSNGITIETLGRYLTLDKAEKAKVKRDSDKNFVMYDVGPSWIEKEEVE